MSITIPVEYLGNKGFIGIAPETAAAYGTPVASTSWLRFISETMGGKPGFKNVPTIGGTRSQYTAKFAGLYGVGGDIVFPLYTTSGMILLAAAIGKDTFASGTHTLAVSEGALPSLTIEKYLAGVTDATLAGPASRQFYGNIVSKLGLKMTVDAEVEATATLMGQGDNQIAPSTPTFLTDVTPFSLLQISATLGGSAAPFITAIDLNIDNDAKALGTFQGTRNPALVYGGNRKVDGTITVAMQDTSNFLAAFAGTFQALVISLIQDSTHQIIITLPNIIFGDTTEPLKDGEVMMETIPFQAYLLAGSTDIGATLKNGVAAAYFS